MSRYIDADALLEKVQFRVRINDDTDKTIKQCVEITRNLIENAPTADVVAVVRCKDCYYSKRAIINDKGFKVCTASGMDITDDDFCSYADRRTDDEAD